MILDFIWHLRSSVDLDDATTGEVALARLERLLAKQFNQVTERSNDDLEFNAPLWRGAFGSNWLALLIYDRGRFWLEQGPAGSRVRYDLRSLHGMVICLFASVSLGVFSGGLKFAIFAFSWLYGMNILLALARVPSLIRGAINRA